MNKLDDKTRARLEGRYHSIIKNVDKCVFCDLREKYLIKRKNGWVLTVNIYPYINGQLLVLPERHIENYKDLAAKDLLISHRLIKEGIELLQAKLKIKNFWIVLRQGKVAGKTVSHLHWNIMPYIEGLNTWHYQKITIEPLELAEKLRGK